MRYFGWSFLVGIVFFIGREWYLQAPGAIQIIAGPEFVNIQVGQTNYLVGEKPAFDRLQPRGYFLSAEQLIRTLDTEVSQQTGYMTRWSEDFIVWQIGAERIFWFGPNFDLKAVQSLPVKLESDVWLLPESISLENLPLPRDAIIWYGTRRVSKKLQDRADEEKTELINPYKNGLKRLRLKTGQWEIR